MIKEFSNKSQAGSIAGRPSQQGGGLGDLLGGATAGGLLNGGLGELLKQFTEKGKKDTVDSWVGTGANRQIAPPDLKPRSAPKCCRSSPAPPG